MSTTTSPITKLWIGGTSGLSRSYFNAFPCSNDSSSDEGRWLVLGLEEHKPAWLPQHVAYACCDLTYLDSIEGARSFWKTVTSSTLSTTIESTTTASLALQQIVLSVRPPLVTSRNHNQAWLYNGRMLAGMECLLSVVLSMSPAVSLMVHVSSIAAVDHVQKQHLRTEPPVVVEPDADDAGPPDPSSRALKQPYDRFKRASEELVDRMVNTFEQRHSTKKLQCTHIRLGAIFSDSPGCIQCSALGLQALVGPFLQIPIDCNSGRNAASLIHCILQQEASADAAAAADSPSFETMNAPPSQSSSSSSQSLLLRPVYYYTRPLSLTAPAPYGYYLQCYRRGHCGYPAWLHVWIPDRWVRAFVAAVHAITRVVGRFVPFLQSIDYLLQVTNEEHSFSLAAVRQDFGGVLGAVEESIETCFKRRRAYLSRQQQQQPRWYHMNTWLWRATTKTTTTTSHDSLSSAPPSSRRRLLSPESSSKVE